jgi:site-specific DNA-methyltransferase (adenine-specific)
MSFNKSLFSSESDLWATPQDFFDSYNKEFNFTLDVCATEENAKCKNFFTKEQDGLKQPWGG